MTNVLSARFKMVVKNSLENVGFRPLFITILWTVSHAKLARMSRFRELNATQLRCPKGAELHLIQKVRFLAHNTRLSLPKPVHSIDMRQHGRENCPTSTGSYNTGITPCMFYHLYQGIKLENHLYGLETRISTIV